MGGRTVDFFEKSAGRLYFAIDLLYWGFTRGYKRKEIAERLRLHYTTVSNLIKRLK